MILLNFTDELLMITHELPNKYTGIIISIHRLGKLYTWKSVAIYFCT
jgi:hypothetical protein